MVNFFCHVAKDQQALIRTPAQHGISPTDRVPSRQRMARLISVPAQINLGIIRDGCKSMINEATSMTLWLTSERIE